MNGGEMVRPADGQMRGNTHFFPVRVYFEDTDLAGIVYHANYLRFMERARSDMLRTAGIDQRAAVEAGEGVYAVADLSIRYRASARLDDDLVVATRVETVRAASVVIQQRVMRGQDILTEAVVTAAFITPEGRPRRQPRAWVETFLRLQQEGDT
ncbi:MAG: acyl-CoA thioester hydrolase [Sphingomonadales bacterium]|jgi:acyl-CoA thioester hydrolase|nr:acyl-CoA thioester hydrolase [Sphingomonadales bacterium]